MENKFKKKDEELFAAVESAKAGKTESCNQIYAFSEKYIYKIINDIVKNHHTTEDIMQETFIQIFNKLDTLQEAKAFYVWAGRIATNKTLRYIQKNNKEVLSTGSEEDENSTDFIFEQASADNEAFIPESILMDREKQRLIANILDKLSIEQKLSVQYFYYEEMSVREIAETMNCSTGTVKSRLNYARKSIKDAVVDLDEKDGTRLYSLAAMPLFWIVFREGVEALVIAGMTAAGVSAAGIATGVGTSTAGATGAATVGTAVGTTAGTASAAGAGVTSGTAAAGAGASTGTAGATVSVKGVGGIAAKVWGTAAGKIATGVIATAVVVTGGYAATHQNSATEPEGNSIRIDFKNSYDTYSENYLDKDFESQDIWYWVDDQEGNEIIDGEEYITDNPDYAPETVMATDETSEFLINSISREEMNEFFEKNQEEAVTLEAEDSKEGKTPSLDLTSRFPEKITLTLGGMEYTIHITSVICEVAVSEYVDGANKDSEQNSRWIDEEIAKQYTCMKRYEGTDEEHTLAYGAVGLHILIDGYCTWEGDITKSPFYVDEDGNYVNKSEVNSEAESETKTSETESKVEVHPEEYVGTGYTITASDTWEKDVENVNDLDFTYAKNVDSTIKPYLYIRIEDISAYYPGMQEEEYCQRIIDSITGGDSAPCEILQSGDCEINGEKAKFLILDGKSGTAEWVAEHFYIVDNGYAYTISYTSGPETFYQIQPEAVQVVNTFRFTR